MWRIGVDLGGTKIEAIALSSEDEAVHRTRVAAPQGDYAATLKAVCDLVDSVAAALGDAPIAGVGIGMPGSHSPKTGLVRNSNSVWLNGTRFENDLRARLRYPLFVENDANCFALSEAADGAGNGFHSVFGVILGTGVGGGLVLGGEVILGRNRLGGEWGHNPLPWPDENELDAPLCYCGKRGCIETFLCGPALEDQYQALSGERVPARTISERAEAGDVHAKAALETYARRLAKSLAAVINIVDPDAIVFGGGISNIPGIFSSARAALPDWVFSDCCMTEFRINRWGDSSGVRGAARLVSMKNGLPRGEPW